jgi:hypothetical protein
MSKRKHSYRLHDDEEPKQTQPAPQRLEPARWSVRIVTNYNTVEIKVTEPNALAAQNTALRLVYNDPLVHNILDSDRPVRLV